MRRRDEYLKQVKQLPLQNKYSFKYEEVRRIKNPFTVPRQSATEKARREVRNLLSICLLLCKGKNRRKER